MGVERAGETVSPCPPLYLTPACKRRLPASARASLPLPAAPDAQRYRAKKSLASLAG